MRRAGLPEEALAAFRPLYAQLLAGASGTIRTRSSSRSGTCLRSPSWGIRIDAPALRRACVIKLNGGLGTSMGMTLRQGAARGPRGAVVPGRDRAPGRRAAGGVRRQAAARAHAQPAHARGFAGRARRAGRRARLPPAPCPEAARGRPERRRSGPADRALEWCPPGHGDLYAALLSSGTRETLLSAGVRYAFVSNADNLGAVLDPLILEWFARSGAPFAMETVIGTEADRKGGHIARRNGRLVLRETAQAESAESFGDHRRWRYYNTNNLWLDLEALTEPPTLPLIVNRKTVDPVRSVLGRSTIDSRPRRRWARRSGRSTAPCAVRAAFALRARQDDGRPARAALGRLRAAGLTAGWTRSPSRPTSRSDPRIYKRIADFEARFAGGCAVAARLPALRRARRRALRCRGRRAGSCRGLRGRTQRHDVLRGVRCSTGDNSR